jgi:ubiquinone/menaquinone biosynthesis C-methylase UbiE
MWSRFVRKAHVSKYYNGKPARLYNRRWHTYTTITLAQTLAMIDFTVLRDDTKRSGQKPRVLDVACGTGILLRQLLGQVPGIEAYGVDASEDMLTQARVALQGQPHVQLECIQIGSGKISSLPFPQPYFALITCTNALHDIPAPASFLAGLGRLLVPGGQLVVEDFAPRQPRFFWAAFEWFLQRVEGNGVHAYTLKEALSLCEQAELHIAGEKVFTIDRFWHGWVLRANKTTSNHNYITNS